MHTPSGSYAQDVIDFTTGVDLVVQSGNDNTLSGVAHLTVMTKSM